jgi:hypothetical protein
LFLILPVLPACGQNVTFNFTAVINRVDIGGTPFAIGQSVSGSYSFDSTASDQDPSPVVGLYRNVTRIELTVPAANYSATATAGASPGFIEVLNDEDGVRDRYVVSMTRPDQIISRPEVAGISLDRLALILRDRITFALSSDALPLVPPVLSAFASGREVDLDLPGVPAIAAELTSLTIASVTTLLDDLVQRVISMNLQSDSLDSKLDAVVNTIDDVNEKNNMAAQNAIYASRHPATRFADADLKPPAAESG